MASQFFRIDGADQATGQDTYLVLQAASKPQAEKLARKQGLLISSIRVARPADWRETKRKPPEDDTERTQHIEVGAYEIPDSSTAEPESQAPPIVDAPRHQEPEPFVDGAVNEADRHHYAPTATGNGPVASHSSASIAAAIVFGCAGAALIVGGVLALTLALWPDIAVRNELQQIDFRLHELSQTILGGMLVTGGFITLAMSLVCYLLRGRSN